MDQIFQLIENSTGIQEVTQIKILKTIIVLFVLWSIRYIILKILWQQSVDIKIRYVWRKTITYFLFFLSLLIISFIWMSGLRSLGTYFGLLSAGIAIALKEPITNLFGWVFIILRKPFNIGDRIQIGDIKGDVIDIRISQFLLIEIGNWVDAEQSTGRIMHIPNNWILNKNLANYTAGFEYIWNEISLIITFESNWEKAKSILETIINKEAETVSLNANLEIQKASRKFMVYYKHLTPIVYMKIGDSGIIFTLRYLTHPRYRRGTEQQIWKKVLTEFSHHRDIDFAYPTTRFYNNLEEGKK